MEAFTQDGEEVALEAIASRAGVGVGTLYRHFPNREALIIAVYQHEVDSLCGAAAELLETQPADAALEGWVAAFVNYIAKRRSMGDALRSAVASDSPLFAETRRRLIEALRLLMEAGAAAGTARADVDAEDVLCIMSSIWHLLPDGPHWREDVGRRLDLVLDGLRYGAHQRA